jgi:hypothetical protein
MNHITSTLNPSPDYGGKNRPNRPAWFFSYRVSRGNALGWYISRFQRTFNAINTSFNGSYNYFILSQQNGFTFL